ncbi:SLC13 family permease [Glaciecola sp. MH2013]|uniref:SLC13 family permease n=1 Tax=Glaciecola sp. MH2013 TaxID=2785524 RepID=UPI0018A00465|nr:SLC13 family permease [Glaciecola sp. MH2013]MBF7073281.1 SLC13 family permease [Glaciecola sp. MH2013]
MTFEQIAVLLIFAATIVSLAATKMRPSSVFSACMLLLVLVQQLKLDEILENLTNTGLVTLVLLLLVSHSIDKTAFIKRLGRAIVRKSFTQSFWRMFAISFSSSALLNNTAIVASLIGPIKQNQLHAPSRLLIPLSYAAILGGTVTLIGTSTNLIVDSFLIEHGHPGFAFFDFTLFGLSAGFACAFLLFMLTPLLPNIASNENNYQRYLLEADVEANSELIGKSVEDNHLRNLPELFLIEIVRKNVVMSPVTPDMVIEENDKLIFSGNVQKIDNIGHIKGLTMFAETDGLLSDNLTEVIVSNRAPIINKTLKELGFRALFDSAVVAIRRDGAQISGKLGELKLQAGDFLLLATGADFQRRDNITKNFFVVSEQKIMRKLKPWQEAFTLIGFLITIALAATSLLPLATGLVFFAASLSLIKVSSISEIKRHLPVNLILVIVGALSLATALENSGVIALTTEALKPLVDDMSPLFALACVYLMTLLLTEFVTNNAAAALMFPFAYGLVVSMNLPLMPFALAVAFAASASFISPYGYQTNLLVFSATNYRFKDFVKIGTPISLLYSTIVILMLHWFYF